MTLIELFLYNDRRSRNLLNVIKYLVKSIPNVEIKTYHIDIDDPADLGKYIFIREEYWAGYATLFLRKYDIKSLPVIVIDGEKMFEGRFPNVRELKNILDRISLKKYVETRQPIVEVKPYTPNIYEERKNDIFNTDREKDVESSKPTCLKCIFFLKHEGKCLKYDIFVKDPQKPPCRFHQ